VRSEPYAVAGVQYPGTGLGGVAETAVIESLLGSNAA
jgi:hypothetical protein